MWLLSTDRAELKYFSTPESVPGGYAILSHVWQGTEQTFHDIQALHSRWKRKPRSRACAKIKQFCKLAQRHGHQWAWIDTCCIDKTSSSELSEAINSMFRYYALSKVCYAYLSDVTSDCPLQELFSDFWRSLWHTRGWTLQELLAPRLVIFLSRDWEVLGTKAELAGVLERITGIPKSVLWLEEELADISIARRMSWAAKRKTTRPEDEAYCLMGLFGVNMPTLYGEGQNAFQRLQEEIMKQSPDTTMFAWGALWRGQDAYSIERDQTHEHGHSEHSYLFARSPAAFSECNECSFSPLRGSSTMEQTRKGVVGIPTFSITPHGVFARLPVVESFGITIALLSWSMDGEHLGLLLTPCPQSVDPSYPLYDTGLGTSDVRMIGLDSQSEGLQLFGESAKVMWKEVYIAHRPPPRIASGSTAPILLNRSIATAFRFPEENLQKLKACGLCLARQSSIPSPWTGSPATMLFFASERADASTVSDRTAFVIHLGCCRGRESITAKGDDSQSSSPDSADTEQLGAHWAYVEHYHPGEMEPDPTRRDWHECPADHIHGWEGQSMAFDISCECHRLTPGSRDANVRLSFSPCSFNPSVTLLLNVDVEAQSRADDEEDVIMCQFRSVWVRTVDRSS